MDEGKKMTSDSIISMVMPVSKYSLEQRQQVIHDYIQQLQKQSEQFNSNFHSERG